MNPARLLVLAAIPLLASLGCEVRSQGGPFGPVRESPLLSTFNGDWKFEFEKTIEARVAAGRPAEEIAFLRQLHSRQPKMGMHGDMSFTGDLAVGQGPLECEYRFFAMHPHGDAVCGKAWHHEDRHDPGDMSKCYVRLRIREGLLYLEVKMKDGSADLDDPDLVGVTEVESGSADTCNAHDPPGEGWSSDWEIYVFSQMQ